MVLCQDFEYCILIGSKARELRFQVKWILQDYQSNNIGNVISKDFVLIRQDLISSMNRLVIDKSWLKNQHQEAIKRNCETTLTIQKDL